MTGVNADLEALDKLFRATVLEFGEVPAWVMTLSEARKALDNLWCEFYADQRERRIYEQNFPIRRGAA